MCIGASDSGTSVHRTRAPLPSKAEAQALHSRVGHTCIGIGHIGHGQALFWHRCAHLPPLRVWAHGCLDACGVECDSGMCASKITCLRVSNPQRETPNHEDTGYGPAGFQPGYSWVPAGFQLGYSSVPATFQLGYSCVPAGSSWSQFGYSWVPAGLQPEHSWEHSWSPAGTQEHSWNPAGNQLELS
jgi:hypothetical protein